MRKTIKVLCALCLLTLSGCWATEEHQKDVEAWAPAVDNYLTLNTTWAQNKDIRIEQIKTAICNLEILHELPPEERSPFCTTTEDDPPEPPCEFGSCPVE